MVDPSLALPALLFAAGGTAHRRELLALKEAGKIRSIGPRLFTSLPEVAGEVASDAAGDGSGDGSGDAAVARAVRESWTQLVSELFPEAMISHRTAFEFRPSPSDEIFLTASTNRVLAYPGLRLHFLRGPAPLPDDPPFLGMRSSSQARMLLENLTRPRNANLESRVDAELIERRLDGILQYEGAARLHQLRDRAGQIAEELGWGGAGKRLDEMIGTRLASLLGSRLFAIAGPAEPPQGQAELSDPACVSRLQLLAAELRSRAFPALVDPCAAAEAPDAAAHLRHKAFFEAYFSCHASGSRFSVEEAARIAFAGARPTERATEAAELLATFQLASELSEASEATETGEATETDELRRRAPADFASLVERLQTRHAALMHARPEAQPGLFKDRRHRVGTALSVDPSMVLGTLRQGFDLYSELPAGLPRAIFLLFLVIEVHPFTDGNARLARLMMNAELTAAGLATALFPTIFFDEVLQAIRALSRRDRPARIAEVVIEAQQLSLLDFSSYPQILDELVRRNWFREPGEARLAL